MSRWISARWLLVWKTQSTQKQIISSITKKSLHFSVNMLHSMTWRKKLRATDPADQITWNLLGLNLLRSLRNTKNIIKEQGILESRVCSLSIIDMCLAESSTSSKLNNKAIEVVEVSCNNQSNKHPHYQQFQILSRCCFQIMIWELADNTLLLRETKLRTILWSFCRNSRFNLK